jgi:AraC-like DNA-binding protein
VSDVPEPVIVSRDAPPRLRGYAHALYDYRERNGPRQRCEIPFPGAALILNLGPALDFPEGRRTSFVGGLTDRPVRYESPGPQRGVQANLTVLGAYRFFGVPMDSLANCTVELEDVLGADGRRLFERIAGVDDRVARLDLLESALAGRIETGPRQDDCVEWAVHRLEEADGCVRVASLAEELGWSPKRLVARFREQVGLPPKRLARLLRFHRVVRTLERDETRLAEVAYACGYADQSHLDREFRSFAGSTPTEFLAAYARRR